MFKQYLALFLLMHIIGDFYVQTQNMAEKKEEKIRVVFLHCAIYFLTSLLISIPFWSFAMLCANIVIGATHFIIDLSKFFLKKYQSSKKKRCENEIGKIFLLDQFLHLCCIFFIAYFMVNNSYELKEHTAVLSFFRTTGISEMLLIKWILAILLIHKPANIMIQKMIGRYKPIKSANDFQKDQNAGRFVGTLERVIMLILISLQQYAAIGLVLTAKSVARYDKIAKDEKFAEYYLLGTLLSTMFVIVCGTMIL